MAVQFTILIPTVGRLDAMRRLVDSLHPELVADRDEVEVLVVDNRKSLDPEPVLEELAGRLPGGRLIRCPMGGKSVALNHAMAQVAGEICVVLDDDTVAAPGWWTAMRRFFAETDYDFMQGRTLADPRDDIGRYDYPMIPLRDLGNERKPYSGLDGTNIAGYARWFRAFPYHEKLGVGASGAGEDNLLCLQVHAAGAKVGYEPQALMFHPVEQERANRRGWLRCHYLGGKSSCYYRRYGMISVLCHTMWAVCSYSLTRLIGRWVPARVRRRESNLMRNLGKLIGTCEQRITGHVIVDVSDAVNHRPAEVAPDGAAPDGQAG